MEDGLAADAAAEQGIDRVAGLAPRALELDLAVQPPVGYQPAQAGKVARRAAVRGELVGKVQRVDPRAGRPVEPAGPEGDHLVLALRPDVHHGAARGEVLDGQPERGPADAVEDEIEIAAGLPGDVFGTQAA